MSMHLKAFLGSFSWEVYFGFNLDINWVFRTICMRFHKKFLLSSSFLVN